ncbi:hypothetical protein HYW46_00930 [Candidatus Daviesbacteria bacterium]|nr:hypothetical protein [Candidatus Daviesbacteria bacterium]
MANLGSIKMQLLIISVVTVLAYSNTFQNGFTIDDHLFVVDWQITKDLANIPKMFTSEFAPGLGEHNGIYRPVRTVFYALSYKIWGINPFGYHLQAVLVHLASTLLVYFIIRELLFVARGSAAAVSRRVSSVVLLPAGTRRDPSAASPLATYLPFVTALLFALHPIHTEPVNYITASFDMIGEMFFFLAFWLYLKSAGNSKVAWRKPFYFLSLFSAVIAFFTDEITLTLPFLLILYDLCFRKEIFKKRYESTHDLTVEVSSLDRTSSDSGKPATLQSGFYRDKLLKNYFPYFLVGIVYIFIRVGVFHITARSQYLGGSFYLTMLTMAKALLRYIELLIWPLNLSINPQVADGIYSWVGPLVKMDKILSQKITDPPILLSALINFILVVVAVKAYRKIPLLSFSIGWFFISLLPVSYLIAQGPIMQERYVYIASFGFCLLLGWLFCVIPDLIRDPFSKAIKIDSRFRGNDKKVLKFLLVTCFLLLISFYGYRTYTRNFDWKNGETVWLKLVEQTPDDAYANLIAGNVFKFRNDLDTARNYYLKTLSLAPDLLNTKDIFGDLYAVEGTAPSEFIRKDGVWVKYFKQGKKIDSGIMFFYPEHWKVQETFEGFTLRGAVLQAQIIYGKELGLGQVQVKIDKSSPEELKQLEGLLSSLRVF